MDDWKYENIMDLLMVQTKMLLQIIVSTDPTKNKVIAEKWEEIFGGMEDVYKKHLEEIHND